MSRHIQDVASIQFQVNTRQANGAMEALKERAADLGRQINDVKRQIANLGEGAVPENPAFVELDNQLKGYMKRLTDVQKAQKDFMRGAKAADQLTKAAAEGNIESLSFRAIKAGQNGLRKRQEGLQPGDASDMKEWRIIENVIKEAQRIVNEASADVQHTIQTIREGGKVSEQTMRQTINTLRDLKASVDETDADFVHWGKDLDFMEAKFKEFGENQRRLKGELVDANDARREMEKLSEQGAKTAEQERQAAEQLIDTYKKEGEQLAQNRADIKQNIADTQKEMEQQQQLIESKHEELAKAEELFGAEQAGRREALDGLQKQAEKERKLANEKADQAELQRQAAEVQKQQTEQLGEKVTKISERLAEINAQKLKPQVDTSEIDALNERLEDLKNKRNIEAFEGISYIQLEGKSRMPYDFELEKSDYMQKFLKKFGLEESYAKRKEPVSTKGMFHGPEDSTIWDIEGWYNGEENGWGMSKEDWKQHLDDYHWFDDNLQKVIESIRAQYEKLGQAMREGVDPESLKGIANGIKKLEALKERMLSVAKKDEDYDLEYGIGGGKWFRQQFGDVEGDMKKAVETVERGLKDVTGKRSAAYKKELEEMQAHWKEEADKSERAVRDYERKIKTIELTIAAINGETSALEEQEKVIESLRQENQGLVNDQLEAQRKNKLLTTGEAFDANGEKMTDIRAFQNRIIEEAQKISPYTSGDQFVLDQDQTKALVENLAKQYEVTYKEMEGRLRAVFNGNQGEGSLFTTAGFDTTFGQYYVNFEKSWEAVNKFKQEVRDAGEALEKADRAAEESTQKYFDAQRALTDAKTNATEVLAQAQQQANEETEEELKLKQDLETLRNEYNRSFDEQNTKQREAIKLQAESIEQQKKAEQAEGAAAKAQGEMVDKQAEFNAQQQEGLKEVGEMSKGYTDLTAKMTTYGAKLQANDEATQKNAENMADAEQRKQQNASLSIKRMEEMLALLKQEYYQEGVNAEAHEEHAKTIQQLEKVIAEEKGKATLQMMTERMGDLGKLSASAFEETKKFWEAMEQGADKGSTKLTEAQENLKKLVEEERRRNEESAGKVIGDMGSFSDKEIADAVKMFEQMRDSLARTDNKWKEFNEQAQKGTEYLEQMKKQDALEKMEERMSHLSTLSDAARAETKKFFEALKLGAEKGSEDLKKAEAALKEIKDLEREQNQKDARILNLVLPNYSEEEISNAIKAGKELLAEMKSGDPAAKTLAESIARAGEYIKKFGIEAARAAERQRQLDNTMRDQFSRMADDMTLKNIMPSKEAVKTQLNYWKRLIDDPKTAKESLQDYRDQLAEVQKMYDVMVEINGRTALAWFKGGSDKDATDNKIKDMVDKLKEYRATLKHETNAQEISDIDVYLQKVGASAKKASEELMEFDKAKELALQAGEDILNAPKGTPAFLASPEEIQTATKSIEKYREELFKTIKTKREAGEATDAEEQELQELAKYLKDLKFNMDNFNMSREKMEELMNTPINAVNLDELRAAIKRADGELKRMEASLGKNSDEYQIFAEKVKNAKNVLKEMEGQTKAASSAWEKAWSRLKTYVGMYMGFNMAWQRVTGTADDLLELSDKLGEVRKTTKLSADEVGRLSENLKSLDVRTSLVDLLSISASAGQLGLKSIEDIEGFTVAANKMMIALPEMGKEATTEIMRVAIATGEVDKIRKQLQEGMIEGDNATAVAMTKIASTIDRLRASSASTAPEITDFVKRVGAVAAQSGISIDQVAALGSTISGLGMRVEMSATALSRMIPAIKNNSFAIANAIGVAPDALRSLFEAGRGMEAILMIFQHLKEQNMNEDSIEKLLGLGGMQDVMKQLNQQGARAGIVFAGLSQNVDELRRQLGIANEAYEENIAIENEFNKMNETTAAKWARLKNTIEEGIIGDSMQRAVGGLIDGLTEILKFLVGDGGINSAIRWIILSLAMLRANIGVTVKDAIVGLRKMDFSFKSLGKTIFSMNALWNLAAVAITFVITKVIQAATSIGELSKAMGEAEGQLIKEMATSEKLFRDLAKAREQERLNAAMAKETTKAEEEKAKATEISTEATEDYMKKLSLVDMLEKQRLETGKFLTGNLTEKTKAIKNAAKVEGDAAAAGEKQRKQSELIAMMEERRASILDFLMQQHEREIVITGDRTKALKKLQSQNELINQLEARRADIMEFLNQKQLQEVVVIGERTKSLKKLWEQNDLISQLEEHRAGILDFLTGKQEKEVKVIESRGKAVKNLETQGSLIEQLEQRRIGMMEFLNQKYLQEVVVIGKRNKAMKNLQQQSEIISQLEQQRAETMDFLMQKHLQEIVVTGDRMKSLEKLWSQNELITKLQERQAEIQEFLNQKQLQEVVVTGERTKSLKKMWEQNELITQLEERRASVMDFLTKRNEQEAATTTKRTEAIKGLQLQTNLISQLEEHRGKLMDFLYHKQLQEIVVTGDRTKALKNLQQQSELITQLDERNASVMDFLTSKHLQEVVVIGKRTKAIEKMQEQNQLITQMEERRADIMDFLTQKHVQEIVVTGNRTKALENLRQQNMLINQLEEQRASILNFLTTQHEKETEATQKQEKAEKEAGKQSALVMMLQKQQTEMTDFLTVKTDKLSAETEKLAEKEGDVAEQTAKVEEGMHRVNIEGNKSAAIIREINSKYGKYLGYMISETSSAQQLAAARELINKKLRETITLKQKEAAMNDIESEYGKKVREGASATDEQIRAAFGDNPEAYARVSVAVSEAAQKYAKDEKRFQQEVQNIIKANVGSLSAASKKNIADNANKGREMTTDQLVSAITSAVYYEADPYRKAVEKYQQEEDTALRVYEARENVARKGSRDAAIKDLNAIMADWKDLVAQYRSAEGEQREKLALAVYKQQRSYANAFANNADYFENDKRKGVFERQVEVMKTYEKGLRSVAGEAIRTYDAMERAETKITGLDLGNDGDSANNPWGGGHEGSSTDWKNMTANQLVERRKQMNEFVKAIQTDSDVQTVLNEDAALKAAIEKGMSSDMRTVINWYNTERLKIQDELHARYLTNTGDWMDPKQSRARKKMLRDETRTYLDELDAYYTERKAKIQEAAVEEGISEAEVKNRTLANEAEWRQRRMELQKMYGEKAKDVTQDEQDAIFAIIAERTEDDVTVVKGMYQKTLDFVNKIEKTSSQGAKEAHEFRAKMDKQAMQDFNKEQAAIHQQMKSIQDIIDKERPFNGITKNLRENLVTMGILTADMSKERDRLMKENADMTDFNARQAAEELKRTTFMLGEAESAYTSTIEDVMRRMADAGMQAWADELRESPKMQEGMMAQLHSTYDAIQEAIKKEASLMKKQAENMWNSILLPGGDGKTTLKEAFEKSISQFGVDQGRVSRANSLIGAGAASERVADKLAIKQMQLQLTMQEHYYNLMRKQGMQRIKDLERQIELAKEEGDIEKQKRLELDKQHADMSLRLAMTKEQTDLLKQQEEIIARTEDSENRLYTTLREWATLLSSSVQSLMEATHAGDAEYYNERAKLNLTGKGGPGAGTYIVIDNEGTSDAKAHYEYLDEREALERQHEIERQNAQAEAWKKVMDDLNNKMNEQITDWINANMQNASIDANTDATLKNTEALMEATAAMRGSSSSSGMEDISGTLQGNATSGTSGTSGASSMLPLTPEEAQEFAQNLGDNPMLFWAEQGDIAAKQMMEQNKKVQQSTQSMFAKMSFAANMYGLAYQTMSNDNLSAEQKFEMFALQAAGQAAIGMLTANLVQTEGQTAVELPGILGKAASQLGPIAGPIAFAAMMALLGGLMGMAVSKVTKSKSQIAQVTGASASAGRLSTGMLTYASGNVNEFTDPASLTPGRSYNVDGADGKTYRAKYTGKNPSTHLTNGPEFHLAGEKGREMIIDAGTTRQITMNENEIWQTIKTLSGGGRVQSRRSMRRGVRAFADGNVDEFETVDSGQLTVDSLGFDPVAMKDSLDKNNELLERALTNGIKGVFNVYGPDGLVATYDKGKKETNRHGERY